MTTFHFNFVIMYRYLFFIALLFRPAAILAEDLLAVYHFAQTSDPILQAAKEALLAAKEKAPQARALFLPSVNANANYSTNRMKTPNDNPIITNGTSTSVSRYSQDTYGLALNQPIFYYHQWVQYAKASEEIKAAHASYAHAEQDLIVRTIKSYFGVLKAMDKLKFAKAQRNAFNKLYEQTEERFKAGLIANTDVQLTKAERDNAYALEISAENALENQKENLREITGKPIEAYYTLQENIELKKPDPENLEAWVHTAAEQNFNLNAARFRLAATKQDINAIKGKHLPTLDLNGAVNRNNKTPFQSKNTTSSIGLQLSIPLFNGGAISSKTKEAIHLYEQAHSEMEALYRKIEAQTRQSYRSVLTQISQVKALKQAIISNKSALQAANESYKAGTRTIVDVLTSQSNLLEAEQNYANARYDYVLESVLLKQAAGILSPEDIQKINAWLLDNTKKN